MARALLPVVLSLALFAALTAPALAAPDPAVEALFDAAADDVGTDDVAALLEQLHARHPELTELHVLGHSVRGRPVYALAIGRDLATRRDRPALLLEGGIHGDESLAPAFALDAAVYLLEHRDDPEVARWLDELVVWVVPLLNPDGRHARRERSSEMGRKNGRDTDADGHWDKLDGVDLNRNFPFVWGESWHGSRPWARHEWYRGPESASEPETRALMQLAESEHFFAAVSYHMGAVGLLVPYTTEARGVRRSPVAWAVARDLAELARSTPGAIRYPLKRNLYPVDGADQDWLHARFGTLALLLEGGKVSPRSVPRRRALVARSRTVWMGLVRRFLDGPALSVVVVDAAGQPAVARVDFVGEPREPWERWTSRCRDGRFDRYLAGPGSYRIRVQPQGEPALEVPVEVGASRTELEIRLPRVVGGRSSAACTGPEGWTARIARPLADPTALRRLASRGAEQLGQLARARVALQLGALEVTPPRLEPAREHHPSPSPELRTVRGASTLASSGATLRALRAHGTPLAVAVVIALVALVIGLTRRRGAS